MLLFETLSQPAIFFTLFGFGFLSGFIFDISAYILYLCNKNKIVGFVLDFIAMAVVSAVFYLLVIWQNYGELRAFEFFGYFGGICLQRITVGKIILKISQKVLKLMRSLYELLQNIIIKKSRRKNSCKE